MAGRSDRPGHRPVRARGHALHLPGGQAAVSPAPRAVAAGRAPPRAAPRARQARRRRRRRPPETERPVADLERHPLQDRLDRPVGTVQIPPRLPRTAASTPPSQAGRTPPRARSAGHGPRTASPGSRTGRPGRRAPRSRRRRGPSRNRRHLELVPQHPGDLDAVPRPADADVEERPEWGRRTPTAASAWSADDTTPTTSYPRSSSVSARSRATTRSSSTTSTDARAVTSGSPCRR